MNLKDTNYLVLHSERMAADKCADSGSEIPGVHPDRTIDARAELQPVHFQRFAKEQYNPVAGL
jgi:hypothetical protein